MMKIVDRIKKLKKEKNAVILAHNYQLPEVQDIADFVGDSLGLSIEAARTDAAIIVFCGVHFMAETAKILSPQKIVLLPDKNAGCPMADMIDAEGLKSLQAKHPDAVTVCYVNTTAAVKALCDYCCTSANALKIVQNILLNHKDKEIIFVPDKYLAQNVAAQVKHDFITGKDIAQPMLKYYRKILCKPKSCIRKPSLLHTRSADRKLRLSPMLLPLPKE